MSTHRGFVHVYTGDGKGKTTAALGLALRAAGAGMRVWFAQFAKGTKTSEQAAVRHLGNLVTMKRYGRPRFIRGTPAAADVAMAARGFAASRAALVSGEYGLVVLDEINIATFCKLITVDAVLDLVAARPRTVELVLTGRHADPRIIAAADLVTEMREVKHYYRHGVKARRGIEH